MIVSFGDRETEELFHGRSKRKLPPDILRTALRKLDVINAARSLIDLYSPPGNRLEQLAGSLLGSTASGSTASGGSSSAGRERMRKRSKSWIITES